MIEINRASNRDRVEVKDRPEKVAQGKWDSDQHLAIEEPMEMPLSGEFHLEQLHTELADLPYFSGVAQRNGRLIVTWTERPSKGALALCRARVKFHVRKAALNG